MNASRNGLVKNCRIENVAGYASHCKGGAKNITYENNLIVNCGEAGIVVGGATGAEFFCPLNAQYESDSIRVFSNVTIGSRVGIRLSCTRDAQITNNTCFGGTAFAIRLLDEGAGETEAASEG